MVINWAIVTPFVVGFFALSGLFRGWWKEALTTVFLAVFLFFLQQPDIAQGFIDLLNRILATIWGLIPLSVQPFITDGLETFFGIQTGGGPIQLDAASPGTWLMMLALALATAILLGHFSVGNPPSFQGGVLGFFIGGVNGFIAMGLVREYLDGRALPGNVAPPTEITLAGSSAFGPAASQVSIQVANMPTVTILDSIIPWVVIGVGLLFLFSIIRTKIGVESHPEKGRKMIYKIPPFYKVPKPPKRREMPEDTLRRFFIA